jgi:hypothetical protein|nr:MAG TPA: hypothetical protein [Caudoviricetes sp.]
MNFKNERLMMSKEEARNRAKELLNENQVDLITKYMFLEQQCKKQKEVISKLNFIKNRKNQGASQENINKMAIEFVNSYLKEVSE